MIRVECAACGASFQAKDELAGRRGRCPRCKAPITVPPGDAPEAAAGPRSAHADAGLGPTRSSRRSGSAPGLNPRSSASGASSSRRAPSGGGARRRHGNRARKGGLGPVLAVIGIAVAIAAGAFMLSGDSSGQAELSQAIELKTVARFDEAIALLERVPETSSVYQTAQDELVDVRGRKAADDARRLELKAGGLYDNIKSVEKHYVMGPGNDAPNYAANARYLLKRCAEFLTRFPEDSRAKEISLYAFRFAKVASLDTPPTESDVNAELNFRIMAHDFRSGVSAIDEYAGGAGADPVAVRRLRDKVQSGSIGYWKTLKAQLDLTSGEENWQQIANMCLRYLQSIEGLPGITPAVDAKTLYAKALQADDPEG